MGKTFEPGAPDAQPAAPKAGPTPEQIARIKAAIANASSLEEVARLEKALKSGNYDIVAEAAPTTGPRWQWPRTSRTFRTGFVKAPVIHFTSSSTQKLQR